MSQSEFSYPETDRFGNPIDQSVGYARGKILKDITNEIEYEKYRDKLLLERLEKLGPKSTALIIDDTDNYSVPSDFQDYYSYGNWYPYIKGEELLKLARQHLGGGEEYNNCVVFNRTTLGTVTTILALSKPGTTVASLAPKIEGRPRWWFQHRAIPKATQLAGCENPITISAKELKQIIEERKVSLIVVTGAYGAVINESDLKGAVELGKEHEIPTFIDDAFSARVRTILYDQSKAADMGVDIVQTSTNKFGMYGPRACISLGRGTYMEQVKSMASELGASANATTISAVIDVLRRYDDENVIEMITHAVKLADSLEEQYGIRVKREISTRTTINPDDLFEIVMERAKISKTEIVPREVTAALHLHLIRKYGWYTDWHFNLTSNFVCFFDTFVASISPDQVKKMTGKVFINKINDVLDDIAEKMHNLEDMRKFLLGARTR